MPLIVTTTIEENSQWSILLTTSKDGEEIQRHFYSAQEPGEYTNTVSELVPADEKHVFATIISLDWGKGWERDGDDTGEDDTYTRDADWDMED